MNTSSSNKSASSAQQASNENGPKGGHIAECMFEFLLAEVLHWIEAEAEESVKNEMNNRHAVIEEQNMGVSADWGTSNEPKAQPGDVSDEKVKQMTFERAAARIESIAYHVGFRLCERLAQTIPSLSLTINMNNGDSALEAVKFLCKEFWIEIFGKQIHKLQTNHRGVFVLKDNELPWLKRLPNDDERSRVAAIQLLSFPCGLIRGALSNFGLSALVSCDFLADGKTFSSCSFNIKLKT